MKLSNNKEKSARMRAKRIMAFAAALVFAMAAFMGCNKNDNEKNAVTHAPEATNDAAKQTELPEETKAVEAKLDSPKAICEFVMNSIEALPKMEKADGELVEDVFGIDTGKLKAYELWLSSDATRADEVAVFELEDDGYKEELKNYLAARLLRAASVAEDYSPEQYEIIMKSTVEEKGDFIFYVVGDNNTKIIAELKKLISN